ncbi:hypothetical protein SAMN05444745_102239 [Arthrobacter sp. OV608]|nr:hypothetical protein SAMN05444745_102239 [Arthrobacter sp. OV608]
MLSTAQQQNYVNVSTRECDVVHASGMVRSCSRSSRPYADALDVK